MSEKNLSGEEEFENVTDNTNEASDLENESDKKEDEKILAAENSAAQDIPLPEDESEIDLVDFLTEVSAYEQDSDDISDGRVAVSSKEKPVQKKVKSVRDLFRNKLIGNILLCFLSLLLFLSVLFAPLCRSKVAVSASRSIDISFSGMDTLKLLFYSVSSLSQEEIVKTDLYSNTNKLARGLNLSSSKLSAEKLEKAKTVLENRLCMDLASNQSPLRPAVLFAAGSFLAFATVSLLFVYKSTDALIREIVSRVKYGKSSRSQDKTPVRLLWYLASMLPLLSYSLLQLASFGNSSRLSVYSSGGSGLCAALIVMSVFAVLGSVYFVISSIVSSSGSEQILDKKSFKRNILFLLLVLLLAVAFFLPLFSISAGRNINTKSASFGISLFDVGIMTGEDVRYYYSSGSFEFSEALRESAKTATSRTSDFSAAEAFNMLLFGVGDNDVRGLYIPIQLLTYAVLIFLIFLLARAFQITANCGNYTSGTAACKTLACLCLVVNMVLETVLFMISKFAITEALMPYISVGIGIGFLLTLVCVIGLFAINPQIAPKGEYADAWYDNADVSYAPYVIKKDA